MASFSERILLIALIFMTASTISMAHKHNHDETWGDDSEVESYLKDLCSETDKPKQCWKIIKPEISRFNDADSRSVAAVVIDLAAAKSRKFSHQLNRYGRHSGDHALKKKYRSCSKNYHNANRKLEVAKRNLDSDSDRKIRTQIDDAAEELKRCKHAFGKISFDPAHIRNRNKEFGLYVEIVKVATNRFIGDYSGKAH